MTSKATILKKLRAAPEVTPLPLPRPFSAMENFADFPKLDPESLLQQFTQRLTALRGEVFAVGSLRDAANLLDEICKTSSITKMVRHHDLLLDALVVENPQVEVLANSHVISNGQFIPGDVFAVFAIGLTTADALVARTGSVVLKAPSAGGRRLSVLPEIHCVLAKKSQIVPTTETWFSEMKADKQWSYGTIITGPSRTADIERILVLGAHGPKRLIVIIIND